MQVEVIDTPSGFEDVKSAWDALFARDPDAHCFLSWNWMAHWFERAGAWSVLAVRENTDGRYIAFLPLRRRTDFSEELGFSTSLLMGGSYFAVYTGFLCDPQHEDTAIPALAEALCRAPWRQLDFHDVFMSSPRVELLFRCLQQKGYTIDKAERPRHVTDNGDRIDHDVYAYVDLPQDFETYLMTSLGSRTRQDVRRALRDLDDPVNDLRVTEADADTIDTHLAFFYDLWGRQWLAGQPKYATWLLECARHMLPNSYRAGVLRVFALWQGGRPLAVHIYLIDVPRRQFVCFLVSRDLSFQKPSPGLLLHACVIRQAIAEGFVSYDLGTGDFAYKFRLGAGRRTIERFRILSPVSDDLERVLDDASLPAVQERVERFLRSGDMAKAELGLRQAARRWLAEPVFKEQAERLEALKRHAGDFANASARHREGHLDAAEREYRNILSLVPRHFGALHQLGVVCLQRGEAHVARDWIRQALDIRPDSAPALCNYANALMALKDFPAAIKTYDRALSIDPAHAASLYGRGGLLKSVGRLDEALRDFRALLSRQPSHPGAAAACAVLEQVVATQRGEEPSMAAEPGSA
ncbi:GNAT family N-acetyltransferase [Rhizobium daejeonense]